MGDGGPGGGVGVGEGSPTGPGLGSDAFGGTPARKRLHDLYTAHLP